MGRSAFTSPGFFRLADRAVTCLFSGQWEEKRREAAEAECRAKKKIKVLGTLELKEQARTLSGIRF